MDDVKELIEFYEARGWNWLLAAEYTLFRINGGILTGHCNCCRFHAVRKREKNAKS